MAQKAKKMAAVLAEVYSQQSQPFILTQQEFTALSGKGKMPTKFLRTLDEYLRKRGYVLIDLHKEQQLIGIAHGDTIAQWPRPPMHEESPAPPQPLAKEQEQRHETPAQEDEGAS